MALLDREMAELYMMTIREYLRMRGVPKGDLPTLISLGKALEADWYASRYYRWYYHLRETWHDMRLRRSAQRDSGMCSEEIPF